MQAALTDTDAIITAYRDHGWHLMRGGTTRDALAEMMGKFEGCAKGKGGSMHLYNPKGGFYGGNGIVGAQCPIGAGIAFKFAYKNSKAPEGVVITLYGDGAANQGQLYEGFNMAALWNLPVIFTCENNLYGMGTSVKRASANEEFHSRCEYIPGIRADGNDYATVKAVTKYSKEWCMAGNGPVVLEMKTYRFMNHSISDKGLYRSSTEVDEYRRKDPIVKLKELLIEHKIMAESEINKLEDKIMEDVSNLVEEVKKLPPPPFRELGTDTFVEKVVVRGIDIRKPIVPE
jgi:pyruvate dehydrogenase E1 component alpha subunit